MTQPSCNPQTACKFTHFWKPPPPKGEEYQIRLVSTFSKNHLGLDGGPTLDYGDYTNSHFVELSR